MILNSDLAFAVLSIFKDSEDYKTADEILKLLGNHVDKSHRDWFLNNLVSVGLLHQKQEGIYPDRIMLYTISQIGIAHLEYLKKEQQKEKIPIKNLQWTKVAAIAAIAGVIISIITVFKDCNCNHQTLKNKSNTQIVIKPADSTKLDTSKKKTASSFSWDGH